jgi:hypothetical protein
MPSVLSKYISEPIVLASSNESPYDPPHRASTEKSNYPIGDVKGLLVTGKSRDVIRERKCVEGVFLGESDGINSSLHSLPNGRTSDSTDSQRLNHSRSESKNSMMNGYGGLVGDPKHSLELGSVSSKPSATLEVSSPAQGKETDPQCLGPKSPESGRLGNGGSKGHTRAHSSSAPQNYSLHPTYLNNFEVSPTTSQAALAPNELSSTPRNRFSSPPILPNPNHTLGGPSNSSLHPAAPRLHHRHTLEVPRLSTSRISRDFSYPGTASEASESGRFSPTPRTPRASNTLARAPTRSVHSDLYLDEVPADSDVAKWTETMRQKRASRRRRKEEEDDEKVIIGNKVDKDHVNWVTAYNMLTGIRFTVSRNNAKVDRELTDADFDARNKLRFDM